MRRVCWWRSGGPVGADPLLDPKPGEFAAIWLAATRAAGGGAVRAAASHPGRRCGPRRPGCLPHDPHASGGIPARSTQRLAGLEFVPTSTIIVFAALTLAERLRGHRQESCSNLTPRPSLPPQKWWGCGYSARSPGAGPADMRRRGQRHGRCVPSAQSRTAGIRAGLALIALAFVIVAGYMVRQIALLPGAYG